MSDENEDERSEEEYDFEDDNDPDYQKETSDEDEDDDDDEEKKKKVIIPKEKVVNNIKGRIINKPKPVIKLPIINKEKPSLSNREFHVFAIAMIEAMEHIASEYQYVMASFPNGTKSISDILQYNQADNTLILAKDIILDVFWEGLNTLTNVMFMTSPEVIGGKDHKDLFCREITKVQLNFCLIYCYLLPITKHTFL